MAQFLIYALPGTFWQAPEKRPSPPTANDLLREQILEAGVLRRRIAKGVNTEGERGRYTACLARIEGALLRRTPRPGEPERAAWVRPEWTADGVRAAIQADRFPALALDDSYFHLLGYVELARRAALRLRGGAATGRGAEDRHDKALVPLGTSVFHPDQLQPHLDHVEAVLREQTALPEGPRRAAAQRSVFLRAVHELGDLGVIEVPVVLDNQGVAVPPGRPSSLPPVTTGDVRAPGEDEEVSRVKKEQMAARLHAEIEQAVDLFPEDQRGGKVNMNSQPHDVSTDVLAQWVRREGDPARIRIVYADGSEAKPFPLRCLHGRSKPDAGRRFRVALMSMRHLDLDRVVDLAWYRNREVSQSRCQAESDDYCFSYSLQLLRELYELTRANREPITLHMYHTGFEPASLGFYRALVAVLTGDEALGAGWARGLDPWLTVLPHYYQGGTNYQPSQAPGPDGQPVVLEWF